MDIQTKHKINSTGSMSVDISEDGAVKLYSYKTVVGYVKNGKVVLVNGGYSTTTAKHLAKYREKYGISKEQTYEYNAFIMRAYLDGVDVSGGMNYKVIR
tara:strand:+ start:213 stop:509 length:297 start_codon:yes stop_codon:yes gene_type:complete